MNYHPTDADANIVSDIIIKAVNDAIEWFATPDSAIPKSFASYMEKTGNSYTYCCCIDLNDILGNEMNNGLDNTFIEPAIEGGWGNTRKMSLEDYIEWISDVAKNNILSSGFIHCWLEDLKEHDKLGLAELMIKVNMRLIQNENVPYFQIKNEVIQSVYYHLRKMAFDD